MTEQRLAGKVALVTGASRGIGREIALRLARDGADIVAHSSKRSGTEQTVADITAMGRRAFACEADIASRSEIAAMFAEIDAGPGRLDIVVNNAGVSVGGGLADVTAEEVEWLFGINTFGPLYVMSEAASRLPDGGRVINISTSTATYPVAGSGIYWASKKAVESFTESWARELGARNITVNTVVPGATLPGMIETSPAFHSLFIEATPAKRMGRAEEIAAVVAFLASPEASWVSGAKIMANGAGDK